MLRQRVDGLAAVQRVSVQQHPDADAPDGGKHTDWGVDLAMRRWQASRQGGTTYIRFSADADAINPLLMKTALIFVYPLNHEWMEAREEDGGT